MAHTLSLLFLLACATHIAGFRQQLLQTSTRRKLEATQNERSIHCNAWLQGGSRVAARSRQVSLTATENEVETSSKPAAVKSGGSKVDFSTFAIGQQYEGSIMSAKVFGVFVDISTGYNVLVPKSKLSQGNYNKLKELADSKSTDKIKIELISVDATNQTLSAKYIDPNFKERSSKNTDLSVFTEGQQLVGTVVSTHEFGCFVNLKEHDVDGLLPMSKMRGTTISKGMEVEVKIDTIDKEKNKLVLALAKDPVTAAPMDGVSPEKWLQGIVNSVTNFGLFVRPAGLDLVGLVHNSRVPRELISALKKRTNVPAGQNKTDVESLFAAGDVVKVRINGMQGGKCELSMLKYSAQDEDEDDYVVEGRDPEEEEGSNRFDDAEEEEGDGMSYDAEDTLLWWQGSPYVKSALVVEPVDEEEEVIMENSAVVEGTWRRMFEVDMREDQADFSTKIKEAEMKELEEEIGELIGLDDDMIVMDTLGSTSSATLASRRLGNFVAMSAMPSEWTEEIAFFKEVKDTEETKITSLRKGKAAEQSEFDLLLREVEVELEASQARMPRRAVESEAAVAEEPSQAQPEPVAASAEAPAEDAPAAE